MDVEHVSRSMSRSTSNTRWSSVTLTVPSIEFSIGTKAASTPRSFAASTYVGDRRQRDELGAGELRDRGGPPQ